MQLTTLLHRLGVLAGAVRLPGRVGTAGTGASADAAGPAGPAGSAPPGAPPAMDEPAADLRDATAARVRGLLADAERDRFDALVAGSRDATVLGRVLAATSSVDAVAEVAGHLADADAHVRRAVREPVRAMARAGRQSDGTTCGSAVLTMLAAQGDPTLALWLATGVVVRAAPPPELAGAPEAALVALAGASREARFAAVQRVLRRRTSTRAVLGIDWPPRFGTPPWTAARAARFLGVAYGHEVLDDTDRPHLDAALDRVERAVAAGVPVPLYTGGDSARGWDTALPRHVVLAVPADGAARLGTLHVWEPGAGAVVVVRRDELTAGRPHAALGRWSHLAWVVPPRLPGLAALR